MKKGSVRDKHYIFEEPDETKASRPVLKPRGEGRPSPLRGNQVKRTPILEQRIIVYLANMVKDQSCEGFKYKDIKKSVSIIIAAEHTVTDGDRYFHKYSMRDEKDNSQFTDLLEIDILELKKLPKANDGTDLWDCLRFIKTNNEEEMEMLAKENPEIEKVYDALQDLSNDEVLRHEAQQHEMYLQNELAINEENYERGMQEGKEQGIKEGMEKSKEQGIQKGMEKGIKEGMEKGKKENSIEIAKNLLSINLPLEQIAVATGLSVDEIKSIKSN